MKRNSTAHRSGSNDEGVSPVIAVILMVAITVVLAATVYVWVSGFATEDTGPEQASATASGVDLDDNGDVEWVKVTLTQGENAPYDWEDVTNSTTANDGTSATEICNTAQGTWNTCDSAFNEGDSWDVGENLWIPCNAEGNHILSFSVGGTTILDTIVSCDESAA